MFLFIVIAFVYLASKFWALAIEIDWSFFKIIALIFFVFAILELFGCVMIDGVAFRLLPLAFTLVAIELLSAPASSGSTNLID